ncbi:MAG: hypothetical protein AAGM22_30340 [Acidobacteriota bacterium]
MPHQDHRSEAADLATAPELDGAELMAGRAEGAEASTEHEGAVAVLGPALPRNPWRHVFHAVKAALACALALGIDSLTGNPDHVTSTFVAVLAVSPVVLLGLRRSLDQVAGSVLGGIFGGAAMLAGLSIHLGIPLAVALSILSCFACGFGRGYPVAAFTALFVQAVPFGDAADTLEVRMLAVATAAASAFLVNVLVSAAAYESIFRRRLRFAEATVSALLVRAADEGPKVVRDGFPMLTELSEELNLAIGELRVRRSSSERLLEGQRRIEDLRRLLHLVLDLAYRLEEEGQPPDALQPWLRWLTQPGGTPPSVPASLAATTSRIRRLGKTLRSQN